jgi:hypothetical protein
MMLYQSGHSPFTDQNMLLLLASPQNTTYVTPTSVIPSPPVIGTNSSTSINTLLSSTQPLLNTVSNQVNYLPLLHTPLTSIPQTTSSGTLIPTMSINTNNSLISSLSPSPQSSASIEPLTISNNNNNENTNTNNETNNKNSEPKSTVLLLENLIALQELESDSEYEDLYLDILEELQSYGKILSLIIPRPANIPINNSAGTDSQSHISPKNPLSQPRLNMGLGLGNVYAEFNSKHELEIAISKLSTRVFNGVRVKGTIFNYDDFINRHYAKNA